MVAKKTQIIFGLILFILVISATATALKTFRVQETELVKVSVEAIDPDQDNLTYYYSAPLNEKGEWQTGYDDAGQYNLTIIASDGIEQTTVQVELIVDNKNQPPQIIKEKITVEENEMVDLKTTVEDPDNDQLTYQFNPPFNLNGQWTPDYDDAGNETTKFTVSDGQFTTKTEVEIEIINTNQLPKIEQIFSEKNKITSQEDEELEFYVEAIDHDEDKLTYLWQMDNEEISTTSLGEYKFDYDDAGEHLLTLFINDSSSFLTQEWKINVENKNRRPELSNLPLTVNEGEKVILDFPELDLDGDLLTYSFAEPLNQEGEWQTDYDDAGKYLLEVTASDGELEENFEVEITVLDKDRAPVLTFVDEWEVYENELLKVELTAIDPDEDDLIITINNAPENSKLDEQTFSWQPDYETIKRKGGAFSYLLNYLRLEDYFLKSKNINLDITVCGKELCSSKGVKLTVYNVNRPPQFINLTDLVVRETELVKLEAQAVDLDGDIIKYHYGYPLGNDGKWQTDYDDRDTYFVDITATDGKLSVTEQIKLRVEKNNRPPTLDVDDDEMIVNENQELQFKVEINDPDTEELDLFLENLPLGASFKDGIFSWQPNYHTVENKTESWWNDFVSSNSYLNRKYSSDKKTFWLNFVGADEEFDVIHPVKLVVKNVNQPPEIVDYLPTTVINTKINEPVVFHVAMKDLDQDKLDYHWYFGANQYRVKDTDTVERTFVVPGQKTVRVTVSDGRKKIAKEWHVNVEGELVHTQPAHFQAVQPASVGVYVINTQPKPKIEPVVIPQQIDNFTLKTYYIEG
ncbi:MAG: hypothetical protein KJ597_07055 [Nanoarchaeota archaeon]|nr:hypothetical protein [Nanoarchaeota archaeon]